MQGIPAAWAAATSWGVSPTTNAWSGVTEPPETTAALRAWLQGQGLGPARGATRADLVAARRLQEDVLHAVAGVVHRRLAPRYGLEVLHREREREDAGGWIHDLGDGACAPRSCLRYLCPSSRLCCVSWSSSPLVARSPCRHRADSIRYGGLCS